MKTNLQRLSKKYSVIESDPNAVDFKESAIEKELQRQEEKAKKIQDIIMKLSQDYNLQIELQV